MDYQEAIDILKKNKPISDPRRCGKELCTACDVAISAMQELQAIHNNGISLERLKDIDFRKQVVEHINYDAYMSLQSELEEYREIGTLEEVREAVEKQRAKKPNNVETEGYRYTDTYRCQTCGGNFSGTGIADYCYHCGQRIDWSEVDK